MSNRRFIVFFLVGIACACLLLALLSFRGTAPAALARNVSVPFGPDEVDGVLVLRKAQTNRLERTAQGGWRLTCPFAAAADAITVKKMLDALLLFTPGDLLLPADLHALGRTPRDFGLEPPRLGVVLSAAGRTFPLEFGCMTPSGAEAYARVGRSGPLFTVPAEAFAAIPDSLDAFRRRRVFDMQLATVVAADFRVPGATFVKLVRSGSAWQIVQPDTAPAEAATVNEVLAKLVDLRAEGFVWPDAWAADADADPATGKVKGARLASYGLDETDGLSVALWTSPTAVERIVFGAPAGTNLVHALVHGGSTVVTVDAAVAELCKSGRERFLDARIFPFGAEALESISVTKGADVYVLARGTNGVWRLESPIVAPADGKAVADLIERILRLKQNERMPKTGTNSTVAVRAGAPAFPSPTNLPAVVVRSDFLATPANLRAKSIMSIPSPSVKRISVVSAGGETVIEQDVTRQTWQLVRSPAPSARMKVSAGGVARMLAALAEVTAVSVENLNAAPEDFRRCGLARPAFTIAVDVTAADAVRRNLLVGNAAPGGGRYVTAGGADAIFIVSRETVAGLTVPLVESETAPAESKETKKQ